MIKPYIDPSELRKSSKFLRYTKDMPIPGLEELHGLEERTGADLLLTQQGLPAPTNDLLMKMHIQAGALLIQIKFDHDLIASILDGRYKASQAKMQATGARAEQCILLFVGQILETELNELISNGTLATQHIPAAKNFDYTAYRKARAMWAFRGGVFEQLTHYSKLAKWISGMAAAMEEIDRMPKREVYQAKQKLFLINDWRNTLFSLPGLGEKRALLIYNALTDKSWYGFEDALEDESLLAIDGIGQGTVETIKSYLKGDKQ